MKKSDIKKAILAINPEYKVSIKKHIIISNACKVYIKLGRTEVVGDFNVYDRVTLENNRIVIEYANSIQGTVLECGNKVI